jgi:serine/threonine-protein kinase
LRRNIIPTVIALLLVLALGSSAFALAAAGGSRTVAPNLVGRTEDAARLAGSRHKPSLNVSVSRRLVSDDPVGTVIGQSPAAGEWLKSGGTIHLTLSKGPPLVVVPPVVGLMWPAPLKPLQDLKFEVVLAHQYDDVAPKDQVLRTDPAPGTGAPRNSAVTVVVSDGPKPVPVPNVVGQKYDDAVKALDAVHLGANRVDDFSETVDPGLVISQDPAANADAARDSKVTLHVSKGPERISVPDVRGMTIEDASNVLQAAGLQVGGVSFYSPHRKVKDQDPSPDTKVKRGTSVDLVLERH